MLAATGSGDPDVGVAGPDDRTRLPKRLGERIFTLAPAKRNHLFKGTKRSIPSQNLRKAL